MVKPLVSFVLITYNQERFIREALESALSQTYSPLEVIVSDDCSTDTTFAVISDMLKGYVGPHKIVLNRNEENLGIAGNINMAHDLASGDIFVMAAGDDISVPDRIVRVMEAFDGAESPDLVCSYFAEIDEAGVPTGFILRDVLFLPDTTMPVYQWQCGATGACAAYRRKLFDKYGPLDPQVVSEDWIFPFRAWLESGCALIKDPIVMHRTHGTSLSVLHKNVNTEKDVLLRRKLRKSCIGNELARARAWLDAYHRSDKSLDSKATAEFKLWIRLAELEERAANNGVIVGLSSALLAACYRRGWRRAARIFFRYVLRIY
jgi:glycosyltransferase involved in cell wall biosynthesis